MVQIVLDMDMPKSCKECPFRRETSIGCPMVPSVVAWQAEIERCTEKRSEHCPLKDVQIHSGTEIINTIEECKKKIQKMIDQIDLMEEILDN